MAEHCGRVGDVWASDCRAIKKGSDEGLVLVFGEQCRVGRRVGDVGGRWRGESLLTIAFKV